MDKVQDIRPVFIGVRAVKNAAGAVWKNPPIIHFNPAFIKMVNEKTMILTIDDGSEYRIDEESLQIFLSAMYGEDTIRGDKLHN